MSQRYPRGRLVNRGGEQARRMKRMEDEKKRYSDAFNKHHSMMMREAFPEPAHDQETGAGVLMKRMLLNQLFREAFNAGWVAAGKVVPS